jgi:hypothetical protein
MSEKSDALAVPVGVTMRRPTLFDVPAMPLYLQLGFEPLVRGDEDREVWGRVLRLLSGEAGGGRVGPPAG